MSGIYGTVRPSDIDLKRDVEIFYYYRPNRSLESDDFKSFKPLDVSCLEKAKCNNGETSLLGMYTLKLPVDKFNRKGYYTIYIKPKEYLVNLFDVSCLVAYPNVRGIVINSNDIDGITDLTGYRVEYFNDLSTSARSENVRLITSCNRCVVTPAAVTESFSKPVRYRLVDSQSDYLFCTVTPSSASSYKPNVPPYIGRANETVALVNTKFNPIMLEVEFVDHDADTLSYMLEGDQIRNRDTAIITTYNDDKEIYHQADYYTIKDKLSNPLYDIKTKRDNLDNSQTYDNIINGNS